MSEQVKFVLDEDRLPEAWYNIAADLPAPPPPVLHPGTRQPVGPDDLAPLFPMSIILQEVSTGPADRDPGGGALSLSPVEADAALPRAPARAGARDSGAHLLQVRGRLADRLAQAEHRRRRRRTTTSKRASSASRPRPAPGSGARRSRSRARLFGLEVRRLHGAGLVRPEAVPPRAHRDVRRHASSRARRRRPTPVARSSREHPDSTGSLGIAISEAVEAAGAARGHEVLARLACSTTSSCTRP